MKLYLIRHSESEDDLIDAYGGAADWKLTENGKETVLKFVKDHQDLDFDFIYSSPLSRAFDTAKIINQEKNVPIKTLFDLREFNQYGVMSGCTKEKSKELFGYLFKMPEFEVMDYYSGKVFYGAETVEELDKRVRDAFSTIFKENCNTVLVVTHTGVFRSLLKNVVKDSRKVKKIADCGLLVLEYENNELNLIDSEGVVIE